MSRPVSSVLILQNDFFEKMGDVGKLDTYYWWLDQLYPQRNRNFTVASPAVQSIFANAFNGQKEYILSKKYCPDSLPVACVKSMIKCDKVFSLFYAVISGSLKVEDYAPHVDVKLFNSIFYYRRRGLISSQVFNLIPTRVKSAYRLKLILPNLKRWGVTNIVLVKWRLIRAPRDIRKLRRTDKTLGLTEEFPHPFDFLSETRQKQINRCLKQFYMIERYCREVLRADILREPGAFNSRQPEHLFYVFAITKQHSEFKVLLPTVKRESNVFNLFNLVELFE